MNLIQETRPARLPLQLAEEAQAFLGDDWVSKEGVWRPDDDARLIGPDGEDLRLIVSTSHGAKRGMVLIRALLGDYRTHVPWGAKERHEINVSFKNLTGERMAREINRRLLPEYRKVLTQARIRKREYDDAEFLKARFARKLVRLLKGRVVSHRTHAGTFGQHWRFGGDFRVHGDYVEFDRLSVPYEVAVQLAKLLAPGLPVTH